MTKSNGRTGERKLGGVLGFIERAGNALPHPATLFASLALLVILISGVAGAFQLTVTHPGTGESIKAVSLFSIRGLHRILTGMVTNFTSFAPLGTVLVALLGIGVAEGSGLIGSALKMLVLSAPRRLLTFVIVFAGVMSNAASEVGYVLLVPLAAVIFLAVGRHPLAGLAAAFAGVSGGYSANLVLGTVDPLLAGLSEEAARIITPGYQVNPACNYYFMAASTFFIALAGTWVTEKIVVPRLGEYRGEARPEEIQQLAPEERRGLRFAVAAGALFLFLLLWGTAAPAISPEAAAAGGFLLSPWILGLAGVLLSALTVLGVARRRYLLSLLVGVVAAGFLLWGAAPFSGFLRNPDTGDLLRSPFMSGIVALIFVAATILGLAYGIGARTIRSDGHVVKAMGKAMETLGVYLVLVFFAAQFVAFFNWTNLGLIFAVKGADLLKASGLGTIPLIICFVLVSATVNMFMGSASAKWAIMAPVFIPMLMLLGYSPEFTQAAYRIGDSVTNIISPMMSYFALIVAFMQRYETRAGIGTIIATMLPYTITFLVVWLVLLVVWILAGLPVGPGAGLYLPTGS